MQDFNMKKISNFYLNAIGFAIILSAVLILADHASTLEGYRYVFTKYTNSLDFLFGNVGTDDINPCIEAVREANCTTRLIIGDSVCRQMFEGLAEHNPGFTVAGTNGAVTMAGQYILAKEYLEAHPGATDIYLIVLPESLARTYDTNVAYQYAVMPFVETGTINDLDADTIKIIESVYGKPFLRPDVVKLIDRSPLNRKLYLNALRDISKGYELTNEMELADRYICKINDLCVSRGINFHLLPAPVSEVFREPVANMQGAYGASNVSRINPHFLDDVYFFHKEEAADDRHFSGDHADQENYNIMIDKLYRDSGLAEALVLKE